MGRSVSAVLALALSVTTHACDRGSSDRLKTTKGASAPVARFESGAAVVFGKLYVIGGYELDSASDSPPIVPTTEMFSYDPIKDGWTRLADMPQGVTHINAVVDGSSIWVAGGFAGQPHDPAVRSVWRYDAVTDTWTEGVPLPAPRAGGGLALVESSLHYFGGYPAIGIQASEKHWALSLDGGSKWSKRAPFPNARGHLGTAVLDGKIYAIGGLYRHDGEDVSDVSVYDPALDSWSELTGLPTARSHLEPSTFAWDDRIIVVGGRDYTSTPRRGGMRDVTAYDPTSDLWTTLPSMHVGLIAPVARVIEDNLIVTLGGRYRWDRPQDSTYIVSIDQLTTR